MKAGPGTASISLHHIPRARMSDFMELTKPKLTSLVLFTTIVGFCTGSSGTIPLLLLVHTLVGTALMAGGAAASTCIPSRRLML